MSDTANDSVESKSQIGLNKRQKDEVRLAAILTILPGGLFFALLATLLGWLTASQIPHQAISDAKTVTDDGNNVLKRLQEKERSFGEIESRLSSLATIGEENKANVQKLLLSHDLGNLRGWPFAIKCTYGNNQEDSNIFRLLHLPPGGENSGTQVHYRSAGPGVVHDLVFELDTKAIFEYKEKLPGLDHDCKVGTSIDQIRNRGDAFYLVQAQ